VLLKAVFFNPLVNCGIVGGCGITGGDSKGPVERSPGRGLARLRAHIAENLIGQGRSLFHGPRADLRDDGVDFRSVIHAITVAFSIRHRQQKNPEQARGSRR